MTLSDFLLARIAEDEASEFGMDGWCGEWKCQPSDERMKAARARVLAECEAKRRIVEGFKFEDSDESAVDAWMAEDARPPAAIQNLIHVAKCLALPYADHPDFREEWRP